MASEIISTENDLTSNDILHHAVIDRDLVKIYKILQDNESWKSTDDEGETILHLAFKRKQRIFDEQKSIIQTLDLFLNEGLSINIKNATGRTILFSAIENRLRDVIDYLLNRGADLNTCDHNGNSVIHVLIESFFKEYFKNCGGLNNILELQETFEREDIDFMFWLLSKDVNVDCINNDKKTALHLAISCNLQHVMPILIQYMKNVNYIDEAGCTIIELFFKTKTSMNIREAVTSTYIRDRYYGSRYDIDIVKFLLNKGVSVDHVDKKGNTLVHTFLGSYDNNPAIIRWMLQRYTKINSRDRNGNTALHLVMMNSFTCLGKHKKNTIDFVRMLLSKGANVHLKNGSNLTTVELAVDIKNVEILKALKEYGANLSPLASTRHLLHEISYTEYLNLDEKVYAPIIDMLVQAGWNVNAVRPNFEYTPLMNACGYNRPDIAEKLIVNGANVNYVTKKNLMRPIHMVVDGGVHNVYEATLFKILAKAGADVNVKNINGRTALHLAKAHNYETIKTLLELGADVDASDKSGNLPLYLAIEEDNVEGIKALLEFGADLNDEDVLRALNARRVFEGGVAYSPNDTPDYLTNQWIKLKAANLPVINGFSDFIKKEEHQQLYTECLEEIETLKTHYLDSLTTLYDLLHMDVNLKYAYLANNEKLREIVKSSSLETSFPNYGIFVMACYNKAIARYPLVEPAKRAWYYLTSIGIPDICVRRILAHMKNEDLRIMAKDVVEINDLKRMSQLSIGDTKRKRQT